MPNVAKGWQRHRNNVRTSDRECGLSAFNGRRAIDRGFSRIWSGRRESNPRHTAWEAVVLPLNYARKTNIIWAFLKGSAKTCCECLGTPSLPAVTTRSERRVQVVPIPQGFPYNIHFLEPPQDCGHWGSGSVCANASFPCSSGVSPGPRPRPWQCQRSTSWLGSRGALRVFIRHELP